MVENNRKTVGSWTYIICGIVAIISLFLPIMRIEDEPMNSIILIAEILSHGFGTSLGIIVTALIVTIALALMMIAYSKHSKLIRFFAMGGVLLLIFIYILPEHILGGEIGIAFEYDLAQYAIGWWLMLISFLAAAVISWIFSLKETGN